MIDQIEKEGGVAKVCGAGGVKTGSGIVMVSQMDEGAIEYLVKKLDILYYKVKVGVEGWQVE